MNKAIYTIGHSTRKLDEFIDILKFFKIEFLVDVRHFPKSTYNPHFNKENLSAELTKSNINYLWIEKLGGFRKGGYLEYMKTEEFKDGLKELVKIAKYNKTVIMCAELLWFKCHRRFISNKLIELGFKVFHIFDKNKVYEHKLREL
jgi:uncharacterized protein (DUF488 family)